MITQRLTEHSSIQTHILLITIKSGKFLMVFSVQVLLLLFYWSFFVFVCLFFFCFFLFFCFFVCLFFGGGGGSYSQQFCFK